MIGVRFALKEQRKTVYAIAQHESRPHRSAIHCRQSLFGQFSAEHPVDAELVREHSETSAPEHILQRQDNFAVFAERCEQLLSFRNTVTPDYDVEVVALLDWIRHHAV